MQKCKLTELEKQKIMTCAFLSTQGLSSGSYPSDQKQTDSDALGFYERSV